MRLLTKAQFARKQKISKARVSQLVLEGKLSVTPDGKINPKQAAMDMKNNMDPTRQRPKKVGSAIAPNGSDGISYIDIKKTHEMLKSRLTELELKVKTNELVPKSWAMEFLALQINTAKAHFLGMPKRFGEVFATLSDAKEIESLLRSEIRRILTELGRQIFNEEKTKR